MSPNSEILKELQPKKEYLILWKIPLVGVGMGPRDDRKSDLGKTIESLVSQFVRFPGILFVMGKGPEAVMEGWLDSKDTSLKVDNGWLSVETKGWHCHLKVEAISSLQFVEGPDVHDTRRQSFSIQFLRNDGEPHLMVFFAEMYNSKGELDDKKVAIFRRLKEQYTFIPEG